jgi:DNA processing protein
MHGFMLAILANNCPYVNTLKHSIYNVKSLTLEGQAIPASLKVLTDTPKILHYRGSKPNDFLDRPTLAIVGSRKVDSYGQYVTKKLSEDTAHAGFTLVSGLALGVDAIVHESTLRMNAPTIAVICCGIDTIYPKTHFGLAKKIVGNGSIISEHSGGYSPRPHDFLTRNRLISGLADGVLVTQAASRSGSLNTARHALEQGKTVFAVPGPIHNPLCEGTNTLIKMGAIPVTDVNDILNGLHINTPTQDSADALLKAQTAEEHLIITLILDGVHDAECMHLKSGLPPAVFNSSLSMLEIRGVIVPLGANNWTLS